MNEATLKTAQILIVDDEVSTTCLTTNFLNRVGYSRLESINDSTLVFDKIAELAPDLILLDLGMPKLNGFQILEKLRRERPVDEQVPVLVLTGDATAENKRRALAAGASDILAKPFDPSEISMRIRTLLQSRFLRLDIQEQNRQLEARVHERTAQLEQALGDLKTAQRHMLQQERLSAFGEMAGGVVHDFSNALMSIIGYSETLLTNDVARADDATVVEYLGIINTAGRDGAHVVNRLRDFYRPRSAADMFERTDVNEIISQSIALARPRYCRGGDGRTISFTTELASSPALINGIPAELREGLVNLICNSVDAIESEGTVTLRTRLLDTEVLIEVHDTGSGMTDEVKRRCLEPFFSTKGESGTGLGLAMVFGIIQRHQARLEIDSATSSGTTFRIRFPRLPGAPAERRVELLVRRALEPALV